MLVSVRDAEEALAAVAGGADIVDAKEPMLGPLAPVSPPALQSICAAVPLSMPLSVALGDARPAELEEIVSGVAPLRCRSAIFFKAALVSGSAGDTAAAMLRATRRLATRPDRPSFILARYVDGPADAMDLGDWVDACAASGAHGLLLDTSRKAGASLLESVDVRSLAALRRHATRRGIWLALAGGVTIDAMEALGRVRPHVVGVRGAVCDGPRTGPLSRKRIELLRGALDGIMTRPQPQASPALQY